MKQLWMAKQRQIVYVLAQVNCALRCWNFRSKITQKHIHMQPFHQQFFMFPWHSWFWKFLLTKCCFWCPASNVNGLHEQTRVLVAIFWETCCCYRWKCAGNFISFQLEQLGYHCRVQVSPNTCHTWVFVDDLLPVKQPSLTCWCNMMLWYIAAVVESIWDPLSMQQTRRLTALVQRLVDNYPTVNAESKPTQVVYEWTVVLVTRM